MRRYVLAAALAGTSLLAASAASAQQAGQSSDTSQDDSVLPDPTPDDVAQDSVDDIIVLGSRIPRTQEEGPAPVTTITAEDILDQGYQDVPDLLRSVTQNNGSTQSPQSYGANTFTPGSRQVDLRGLGPNHTLVLLNGRRIADFPEPLGGNSNVADISTIPVGLLERVEVLSGSASAIYGSDAISGVVNFQLKKKVDGTRIDATFGTTEHGGGTSYRLTGTSGFQSGDLSVVFGAEFKKQKPLWGYDRDVQDSSADNPTTDTPIAIRNFLRTDEYYDYLDPGAATCESLSNLNMGTTYYASRPGYGYDIQSGEYVDGRYCGSNEAYGYGTIISDRTMANLFGSARYEIGDRTELFLDAQFGYSYTKLFNGFTSWYYQAPDGNEEGTFYNPDYLAPGDTYSELSLDNWYRLFTPEETGGFENGMTRNKSYVFNVTPGIKGKFGKDSVWNYELYYNHAEYRSRLAFPETVIDASNDFFLGDPIDDPDNMTGYQRFNADPARLFTPLTPAEYASITQDTVYHPKSWVNNVQATINTANLFDLPAGPVGFAAVAEFGNQGYNTHPDPKALTDYYVGIRDSAGAGKRTHWGVGGELRVPVFDILQLNGAGRYDHYNYAGHGFGEFTYNIGAELRPTKTLLIRGAMGTGFRAPDLHYVYRGPGTVNSGGADYFACRQAEDSPDFSDCVNSYYESFVNQRSGNRALLPETARSINAGVVWAPNPHFDVSADYFRVKLENQVLNLSIDNLLRDEADCRLGQNLSGTAIDPASPTCVDALDRVVRYSSGAREGDIQLVNVVPINVAKETTDGIDVAVNGRFSIAGAGNFSLGASYTYVLNHTIRQYPGDPVLDQFKVENGYDIPRDKATAHLTWSLPRFSTTLTGFRTGKLTNWNYDDKLPASYLFNLTAQYSITDRIRVTGTVNNLFDRDPVPDPSKASYPYYNQSWYSSIGRRYFLQLTYKMGGSPL